MLYEEQSGDLSLALVGDAAGGRARAVVGRARPRSAGIDVDSIA